MNIREQLGVLLTHGVEFVVVGGQAGVLRQAIEFSHDLDVIIHCTPDNAKRVQTAVQAITGIEPELDLLLGRDFQQYVDPESGAEIDVHLKLIALPDYETASRCASDVDFLGCIVPVLELPALYASKRTDRPRDAIHRRAIEDRLRRLVLDGVIESDEIVLACCLDSAVAALPRVAGQLARLAATSTQPLLQIRLLALGTEIERLKTNSSLHPTTRSLLTLESGAQKKLLSHPARLATLLTRVPLLLPAAGYHVQARHQ